MIKGLLGALLLAASGTASATLQSGQTFIAHRDELANAGMEWTIANHLTTKEQCKAERQDKVAKADAKKKAVKKCVNPFGARMSVTGFYGESTNKTDLAYLFGMGTTGAIKVTAGNPIILNSSYLPDLAATATAMDTTLYNVEIHHTPNSDGSSLAASAGTNGAGDPDTAQDRVPMYGTLNFAPKRQVYGAHLGWTQSLDSLLKGLEFTVRAPIVQVRTSMKATTTGAHASSIPAEDGKSGQGLLDYFGGNLTTDIATYIHVSQKALTQDKIDNTFGTVTGLADVELGVNYKFDCAKMKAVTFGVGALVQIPTGNKPDMNRLFEAVYGNRGHVAAGARGFVHVDAYKKGDMRIGIDAALNWKYSFKNTEKRTMGIYDITNKVMVAASPYRLVMQNGVTGVQPAANVLTVDHDVTPRNQVDAVAGFCVEYKNFTFDLGYNFYWHQSDVVAMKAGAWTNDKFALAHPHYSMNTHAPADDGDTDTIYVVGGSSYLTGNHVINNNGGFIGRHDDTNDYDDPLSQVEKHSYVIGANGDAGGTPGIIAFGKLDGDTVAVDNNYPGAYTSLNGPIQVSGATTSALFKQIVDVENTELQGINVADTTKLNVRYNVSSAPAATCNQMTHSVIGGVSYKVAGNYPMVIGVGGQGEFQAASRNSALEGFKVWAKFGISF